MSRTIYVYREFPKWITDPDGPVIVESPEEERHYCDRARCIRWERARDIGRVRANAVQAARADAFAAEVAPMIASIRDEGIASLRGIADALNSRGISSSRGGRWQAGQVQRLLERLVARAQLAPQNSVR